MAQPADRADSTTRRSATTRRRRRSRSSRAWTRSIPKSGRRSRSSAFRSRNRSCWPAWRSTPSSTASRWRRRSADKLAELGIIFCSFSEAVKDHPELVRKYLGSVVPYTDNFYATLNSAVFSDGSFVYVPKGVRCPMELSTYFRINAKNTGQFERTLIVADEGAYCELPRRLHRADARREPAARGGRRAGRARSRDDQILDDSELVPGRQERQGRHLQLRHQARQGAGAREDHLDAGRDRFVDHLEVPELHPPGRSLGRRVLLGRDDQQLAAGRHRHEDDPSREEHPEHDRLQGHLGRPRAEHVSRRRQDRQERARARATTRSAIRCSSGTSAARTRSRISKSRTRRRRSSTKRRRRRSARTRSSIAASAASRPKTPST